MIISQLDFLKYIFKKTQAGLNISVSLIAKDFQITTPSVTQALRSMSLKKWINWQPRKAITITNEGKLEALKLIRRHRILECFLLQVMKCDLWQVHVEAEKLEHVVSDQLLKKMYELCGKPQYDPHGHGIPDLKGNFPLIPNHIKLFELPINTNSRICLIDDENLIPMKEVVKKNILFGAQVQKISENKVKMNGKVLTLSPIVMKSIGVELV